MKQRILSFASYIVYWLVFFAAARLVFILFQMKEASAYSLTELLLSFLHGLRLDLSATGYVLLLPVLVSVFSLWIRGRWFNLFMNVYTVLVVLISVLIITGDASVYRYWAYRLEFSIMEYLKTPGEAMASARTGEIIVAVLAYFAFTALFIFAWFRYPGRYFRQYGPVGYRIPATAVTLFFFAFLILPIRGGTGVAPINTGAVYFSDKLFLNHAAINEVWNFGHTAAYSKPSKNPYGFNTSEAAEKDLELLTSHSGNTLKILNKENPDIILVILESFGSYITDPLVKDSLAAPNFHAIADSGLYFSNFFAAGSRTDKAIPAILSGHPNLPTIQILRDSKKTQSLPSLVRDLETKGYSSSFWYGGDINFANLRSYLLTSGYDRLVTIEDFSSRDYNSKWGVHDHIVFDTLSSVIRGMESPFFCTLLTLSSHEPFEVPMEPWFKGNNEFSRFRNAVMYTDRSLGKFIESIRSSGKWDNTLVILMADHCRRYSEKVPVYSEEIYRIPMVWTGGALAVKDSVISSPASQFDFPETLSAQLGIDGNYRFGKNLLSDSVKNHAFYTYNEGYAFITDSSKVIFDIKLGQPIVSEGVSPKLAERFGKSFLQVLFDDYLKR